MADILFSCPHCSQSITCDELWSGQQIQCPICQKELTVPAQQAAPAADSPLVPKPPAGGGKLAINQTYHSQQSAALGESDAHKSVPIRNLTPPKEKGKNPLVTVLIVLAMLAILGGGGYFGYDWYKKKKEQTAAAEEAAQTEAANAQAGASADTNAAQAVSFENKPLVPPVWNLDLTAAKIPECKVNGSISGTNFVIETARIDLDPVGGAQVLRLFQGQSVSPDREILVYLRLKPGEQLGGQTLAISSDMKTGVPRVAKRWKTSPQYAPTLKSFSLGYVMKLELGQVADNAVPGKIYLALPDNEHSVIAGEFKATLPVVDPNAPPVQQAVTPATPTAPDPTRDAYQRRYGTRR